MSAVPEYAPGTRFGRWGVVRREGSNRRNERVYLCQCECGAQKLLPSPVLRSGQSQSCGCYKADLQRTRKTTHGASNTATYKCWHNMLQRCTNPKNTHFKNYGGRGISVCPEWHSFPAFLASMGFAPDGLTLERARNDEGYHPGNCVWATRAAQSSNTRSTRRFERNGEMVTLAELAAIAGVKTHTMYCRLVSYKWPMERACPSTPKEN